MPGPLRTFMVVIWVTSLAGATLVALMVMGAVTWVSFVIAGVTGLILGVPLGVWSAKAIKREDPNWPRRRPRLRDTRG